jgi:glucan biosynthesis protein
MVGRTEKGNKDSESEFPSFQHFWYIFSVYKNEQQFNILTLNDGNGG